MNDKQPTVREELQKTRLFSNNKSSIHTIINELGNRIQQPQKIATSFLDSCATYTYRQKIGTDLTNEKASEITTLKSGEMLLTGSTDKNNFQDDALLVKLDANGNVLWIKTFGENDKQEIFLKARETRDGGIIAIGTAYDLSFSTGFILVCKMDVNGTLQWTRKYRSASDVLGRGADIIELNNNNLAFVGDNGKNLLYGKLSASGNLLWDQKINVSQTTTALSIIEDYNGWFIASTGMDTGWHVSNIIKVDSGNGNFIWRRRFGGSNMNAHYIFQKCEFINLRPRISGIYSIAGQPYQFMRVNVNTGSLIESIEQYSTPGITIDATSNIVITPWGEALAFSPNDKSSNIFFFRHIPDVSPSWAFSYTASTNLQVAAIEKTYDAGFIAACNLANNSANDILLIKVDSAGLSPGCDGSPFTISSTTVRPAIPGPSATNSNETLVFDNNLIPVNNIQLDTFFYCRQLTCPTRPIEDTCLLTFHKNYRSYNFCEVGTSFSITDDNHLILSGLNRDNPYDASWERAFVIKTDDKGNLVMKKRFAIDENCVILKQLKLADKNILAMGYYGNGYGGGFFLLKLDNNLNILWSKTYPVTQTSWNIADVTEAADGSIFLGLYYYDFATLSDRMALLKFDNTGNFLWQKTYRSSGSISLFAHYGSLISSGAEIYFVSHLFYVTEQKWKTLITKIDAASGNISWSKRYSYPGQLTQFMESFKLKDNSLYLHGFIDLPSQTYQAFMIIDPSGNIVKSKAQTNPMSSMHYVSAEASNSDILLSGDFYDYTTNPPGLYDVFVRLDSDLNIKYSKKKPLVNIGWASQMKEDQQGYAFVYGYNYYDNAYNDDLSLKKYSPDGILGTCPSDSFSFDQPAINLVVADQGMTTTNGPLVPPASINVTEVVYSLQQNTLNCASTTKCDTIWLKGPSAACDSTNVYTFRANKNVECTASVNWLYNLSEIKVQEKNDTLIKVKFLKNGMIKIKARLYTGCRILEDSAQANVKISPAQLSLGPDIALCPNNSLLVNAHGGFDSYLWQDGSSDSSFLVVAPGQYFVQATNACMDSYRDTVTITAAAPIPFDLGPDLSKCNHDSVTVAAPPGFMNYTWGPNYNIGSTGGQMATLFPAVDTMYKVAAEKTPGCFAYDSIRIHVNYSPMINLGADDSFCRGDSVLLNAASGFNSYQWSTGQSTQQITVRNTGSYTVAGIDGNNCSSRDTIQITVYDNPDVNLPKDSLLCLGASQQLDAGPGFRNYQWSTGSTAQVISVNTPGTYWIEVTDNHDCKGSDTARIVELLPLPSKFLPADTVICTYQTMQLKPLASYKKYLWSNGTASQNITISQAGVYWLQVTDNFNCTGKDTILVNPKQCLEGFYIPSAFTPNKDGRNDIFRPLLFGNVIKYHFIIYDRWGEKVFETTDLQKGWDGRINGFDQSSFVFVWQCFYQFEGANPSFQKGTVTLIR